MVIASMRAMAATIVLNLVGVVHEGGQRCRVLMWRWLEAEFTRSETRQGRGVGVAMDF